MDEIPSGPGPGYRDLRSSDDPRVIFAPHRITEEGNTRFVYPAVGMTISTMDQDEGPWQPVIRMDHLEGPISLLFVATEAEMRAFAATLTDLADRMAGEANALLASTLARRPKP